MNSTKFCPKCGAPTHPGQVFCGRCGQRVDIPAEIQGTPQGFAPYAPAGAPYAQPAKKGTLLIILSIVFFVLAAAAVAAIFLFGPYDAKSKELNGEWDCVLTVDSIFNEKTDYIDEEDLGDEKDTQMILELDKSGKGKMNISGIVFNASYKGGKINAKSMLDDKLEFNLDGVLKKEKEAFVFSGTWKYTIVKGKDKGNVAQGSWGAELVGPAGAGPE